jgi:hypothetical protein
LYEQDRRRRRFERLRARAGWHVDSRLRQEGFFKGRQIYDDTFK